MRPFFIKSIIFLEIIRPITPETIPVLGGAAEIDVPFGVMCGCEIGPGGANAIPPAKIFL